MSPQCGDAQSRQSVQGQPFRELLTWGRFVGEVVRVEALSAVAKVRDMVSSIPTVSSHKGEAVN